MKERSWTKIRIDIERTIKRLKEVTERLKEEQGRETSSPADPRDPRGYSTGPSVTLDELRNRLEDQRDE